ncbi:hypothetical protein [Rhodococcus sp. P1Y]|uniref:hypothetical protein n=1 Tax=Rhodococcus sp. P1Y TaxID=1302308 RepID=UPI000EAE50E8|nr:hypothetical protein [Rhodococcus sp. P1Y]AYJ47676.1 hypothetical protein D8W71_04250 [Rhodococcus sp. P1Y]
MGVVIASTATEPILASGIDAAAVAVREALDGAGLDPARVHALINVGVYRDSNIVEPAVSALVSNKAGIGLEYFTGAVPTFSFDLMNGPCGFLNAVQVATSLLSTGSVANVVICSGDVHPSMTPQPHEVFPIAGIAAAVVLVQDDTDAGFGVLRTDSVTGPVETEGGVTISKAGTTGRASITVTRSIDGAASVALAASVARSAVESAQLDPAGVALIAGCPFDGFGAEVGDMLGAGGVVVPEHQGDPHTSSLQLAYQQAMKNERLVEYRDLVFVAGGGPTAAAITYRQKIGVRV